MSNVNSFACIYIHTKNHLKKSTGRMKLQTGSEERHLSITIPHQLYDRFPSADHFELKHGSSDHNKSVGKRSGSYSASNH